MKRCIYVWANSRKQSICYNPLEGRGLSVVEENSNSRLGKYWIVIDLDVGYYFLTHESVNDLMSLNV